MNSTKMIFLALAALCATAAVTFDPPKPNPPTEFTISAFALTESGYTSARIYYDQANQRVRTDTFDKDFSPLGEFIASWESNQAFWYDSTTGLCSIWGLSSSWVDAWSFLDEAEYWGVDSYIGDKGCDLWVTTLGNGYYIAACFSDDVPVFIGSYNGTQVEALYFITTFVGSVDPAAFNPPSTCDSATYKLSARPFMNLKKFKVPEHPLLF